MAASMYDRKAGKGLAEIEGAARQLPLSMVLVLVGGKRSAAELQQMLPAATPQTVQSPLEDGWVAPEPAPAPPPAWTLAPPAAEPAAAAADPMSDACAMPGRFGRGRAARP
jgi:hypothetical protein